LPIKRYIERPVMACNAHLNAHGSALLQCVVQAHLMQPLLPGSRHVLSEQPVSAKVREQSLFEDLFS